MAVAILLAASVAFVAFKARLLTRGGAVAAAAIGAVSLRAGPAWIVLLLFFFVTANALTRWRAAERDRRIGGVVEKGGRRDALQVVANGGVFALAAAGFALADAAVAGFSLGTADVWRALAGGAIATATADTWSTEIGTVLGRAPRLILTGRRVAAGTSGAITIPGTAAAVSGALLAALVARSMSWGTAFLAVFAGGLAGSLLDSVLGATIQERRWCDACGSETEQHVHRCGTATRHRRGIPGLGNDMVNLSSTLAGAAITWLLA